MTRPLVSNEGEDPPFENHERWGTHGLDSSASFTG